MQKKAYMKISILFIFPTWSRWDIRENSKTPTFLHKIRIEIVVFDLYETWWRQCWRHTEKSDESLVAQFATHQEILPKLDFHTLVKSLRKKWHFCDAPLNFEYFALSFRPRIWIARSKAFTFGPIYFFVFYTSFGRFCIFWGFWIGHISWKK